MYYAFACSSLFAQLTLDSLFAPLFLHQFQRMAGHGHCCESLHPAVFQLYSYQLNQSEVITPQKYRMAKKNPH